jgi:hypothetical protein
MRRITSEIGLALVICALTATAFFAGAPAIFPAFACP